MAKKAAVKKSSVVSIEGLAGFQRALELSIDFNKALRQELAIAILKASGFVVVPGDVVFFDGTQTYQKQFTNATFMITRIQYAGSQDGDRKWHSTPSQVDMNHCISFFGVRSGDRGYSKREIELPMVTSLAMHCVILT